MLCRAPGPDGRHDVPGGAHRRSLRSPSRGSGAIPGRRTGEFIRERDRVATVWTAMRGRLVRWASGGTSVPRGPRRAGPDRGCGHSYGRRERPGPGGRYDRRSAACIRKGGRRWPEQPLLAERQSASSLSRDRDETQESRSPGSFAPTPGWWAAEFRLARFGPPTPTRAGRLFDASVDPTEARNTPVLHS
jgi:hypothetical protein